MITLPMAYAVTTQPISPVVAPRFPLISFNDTLTIVVSTISSKAHMIAVMVMITLLDPYSTNEFACTILFSCPLSDIVIKCRVCTIHHLSQDAHPQKHSSPVLIFLPTHPKDR